jgi:hypothetical protein
MDKYTLEVGKHYGYPQCCIEWFAKERIAKHPLEMEPLTAKQNEAHGGTGFVPCPKCAETVTAATLHTLIKNRQCSLPFPEEKEEELLPLRKKYLHHQH